MTRRSGCRRIGATLLCLGLLSTTALAQDKKGGDDTADLFEALGGGLGDSKGGLNDLKQATEGVGPANQKGSDEPLSLRKKAVVGDGKVTVKTVFAARTIKIKNGKCEPLPERVKFFVAPDFPFQADRFSVCAHLEADTGRSMRMSVAVMTGRGKIIGSAESIADFTGKRRLEHAIDFPVMDFPEPGVYRYIIEIEGERVANMPLFEVRPQADPELPE